MTTITTKTAAVALALAVGAAMPYAVMAEESALEAAFPGEFSGGVAFTTDYLFRGVSQTDSEPAIQGNIDWGHDSGLHGGIWASNVDFTDADIEIDYIFGLSHDFSGLSTDISGIYYQYPGSDDDTLDYAYWELALSAGYDFGFISTGLSFNFSPDNFGGSGDAHYTAFSASVPLEAFIPLNALALNGHVGRQEIEDNITFALPDYVDYAVGVSTTFKGIDLDLSWWSTDMDESECDEACDKVVFTASKSF